MGIKLLFIAERDWLECENRFAHLVHWLDLVLKTLRRDYRAEVTGSIYDNWCTAWNSCAANAGKIGGALDKWVAYADGAGLASNACITNIIIVVACGEVGTGDIA